jgi:hypothetical protein
VEVSSTIRLKTTELHAFLSVVLIGLCACTFGAGTERPFSESHDSVKWEGDTAEITLTPAVYYGPASYVHCPWLLRLTHGAATCPAHGRRSRSQT